MEEKALLLFVLKRILHLPLQPFQAVKLRKQPIEFVDVFTIFQQLLFRNYEFNLFNIIYRPYGIYLKLKRAVDFCFIISVYLLF
jgi:hypothetical protein